MAYNGNSMVVDPLTGFLSPSRNYNLTGFTAEQKTILLDMLKVKFNVGAACKAVGISRQHLYLCMKADKELEHQYYEIKDQHLDDIEANMYDKAKLLSKDGTLPGIFLLKTQRNAIYGDKTVIQHEAKPVDNLWNAIDVTEVAPDAALPSPAVAQPPTLPYGEHPLGKGQVKA